MFEARHIRLEAGDHAGAIRFLDDRVEARALAEGGRKVVTVTRAGTFYGPRYGEFEISRKMLQQMVANFEANVYGQEVPLDVSHRPQDGAAGWIRRPALLSGVVFLTEPVEKLVERSGEPSLSPRLSGGEAVLINLCAKRKNSSKISYKAANPANCGGFGLSRGLGCGSGIAVGEICQR